MKKTVENDILFEDVTRMLNEGIQVTLTVKGRSMSPYIRHAKDSVVLAKADSEKLAVGDIVLAKTTQGQFVLHRIIRLEGEKAVLMGDGNLKGTENCLQSDIRGKVLFIERRGRRTDCNTPCQRRKAAVLRSIHRTYLRTRHFFGNILRKLHLR